MVSIPAFFGWKENHSYLSFRASNLLAPSWKWKCKWISYSGWWNKQFIYSLRCAHLQEKWILTFEATNLKRKHGVELQKFKIPQNCKNFSSLSVCLSLALALNVFVCWYGWHENFASVVASWKLKWKHGVRTSYTFCNCGEGKNGKCLSTFLRRISSIKRNIQFSIPNLCVITVRCNRSHAQAQSQEMSTFVSYKSFCCA